MLTDSDARALLREAAGTIDVAPAGPLAAPPRRPWWPAAAAAAAAVAVVALGVTLASGENHDDPQPAAPLPDDGRFRFGPDQVPSVFGYSAEDAAAMLEERGFKSWIAPVGWCGDRGRAVGTVPETGALVEPGGEVMVKESLGTSEAYCVYGADDPRRTEAWALFDLVGGRSGTGLALAPEVTVYDGDAATTLRASDLSAWGPLVEVVREMSGVQQLVYHRGRFVEPNLSTQFGVRQECGEPRPAALTGRRGLAVWAEVPGDGVIPLFRCRNVVLFHDDHGAVDAVYVVDTTGATDHLTPPPVVGNSAEFATERLEALGYEVDVVERVDCGQPGLVIAQWPLPTAEESRSGTNAQLAVVSTTGPCSRQQLPVTPTTAAADALVEFFRGGPPPEFSDQVTLFDTDLPAIELTGEQATDPQAWGALWPDVSGGATRTDVLGDCVVRGDDLSQLPDGEPASVGDGEPRTCAEDWSALVWVDDAGAITAVDLLRGGP